VGLNIKNPEAHRLAGELARLTGENLTEAVTEALRERLERERRRRQRQALSDELLAIGRRCAARMPQPADSSDHGDLLYDELGLPK
jgi:antitoxin VapB